MSKLIGLIASILAILAFLGITNINDLSPPATTVPTPTTFPFRPKSPFHATTQPPTTDPERARWDYVQRADDACYQAAKRSTGGRVTYEWMQRQLRLRQEMLDRWAKIRVPQPWLPDVLKSFHDFEKANNHWWQMMQALKRQSPADFNAELRSYTLFDDSAITYANRVGFSTCNWKWPYPREWSVES